MVDRFWASRMTFAEVARRLGGTRQNWKQRGDRGSIPVDHDQDGKPGVPMEWVLETLKMRRRDSEEEVVNA